MYKAISQMQSNITDIPLAAIIAKNKNRILKPVVEIIDEIGRPKEKFIEFEEKRLALLKKYAARNDVGNIKYENDNENIAIDDKKKAEFKKKLNALEVEYREEIAEQEKRYTSFQKHINGEETLPEFTKIKMDALTKAIKEITVTQMEALLPMIEDA